ncbi:MAG: NAD(P)H-dependent oxidoreductase [Actinomycetes bacterium]
MKLMHIIATPRIADCCTLLASSLIIDELARQDPGLVVDELDLFPSQSAHRPGNTADSRSPLVPAQSAEPECDRSREHAESLITRFLAADRYLVTEPEWNLDVPHRLKCFLDVIIAPGRLFDYDERGRVVGLATNKKMIICQSGGGNYVGTGPATQGYQENYLRVIFGLAGISDIGAIEAGAVGCTATQELHTTTAEAAAYLLAGPSTIDVTDAIAKHSGAASTTHP